MATISIDIVEEMAEDRAEELFTEDFFDTMTDSWYLDEVFKFEENGLDDEDTSRYMDVLVRLKDVYYDRLFPNQRSNAACMHFANELSAVVAGIEEAKGKLSGFNVDDTVTDKLADVINTFKSMVVD